MINDKSTNAAIILFNMGNFPPTVEAEKKFKEWSNSMKSISFGLCDVNNLGDDVAFYDASGKESKNNIFGFVYFCRI